VEYNNLMVKARATIGKEKSGLNNQVSPEIKKTLNSWKLAKKLLRLKPENRIL
jgi:hypothetical protein